MKTLKFTKLALLLSIPFTAWAISWSMNGFSAPSIFQQAASALGLVVTEVCRPPNVRYGVRNSLHKRCQAMDVRARTTPSSAIAALRSQFGICAHRHGAHGEYNSTGDHYHLTLCSTPSSMVASRSNARAWARVARSRNRGYVRVAAAQDWDPFSGFGDVFGTN
jgi:hypothetical protein